MRDPLRDFTGQRVLARRAGGATILGTLARVTSRDVVLVDASEHVADELVPLDGPQVRSRSGLDVQVAEPAATPQPVPDSGRTDAPTSQGRRRWGGPVIAPFEDQG